MRRLIRTFLLASWMAVCPIESSMGQQLPVAKPEDVGVSSEKLAKITEFNQKLIADQKIAGAVIAVARSGKLVFLETAGMMDREAGRRMQPDTIFRIASMTKPITTVAAMILYDEGKIALEDPVSKYIPEFKNPTVLVKAGSTETISAGAEITLRHLLTHTSGLTYHMNPVVGPLYRQRGIPIGLIQEEGILGDRIRILGKIPLLNPPGKAWEYSLSTDVLGRVVECVSGKALDAFFTDRIFKPLGMTDTHFFLPKEKTERLAPVYMRTDEGKLQRLGSERLKYLDAFEYSVDYPVRGPRRYFCGGGGLCSTVPDYLRLCQMLLNGGELDGVRLLRPQTVTMMTMNQIGDLRVSFGGQKFGLGFILPEKEQLPNAQGLEGSYTFSGFFSTGFWVVPKRELVVVYMTQHPPHADFQKWHDSLLELAAAAVVD